MTPEQKLAYIINNVGDALDCAETELLFIDHLTFKHTGLKTYCTSKFLSKFLRPIEIITQHPDKEKKIPKISYWAYSTKGVRRIMKDKWFLEKLIEVVYCGQEDRLYAFKSNGSVGVSEPPQTDID